MCVRTGMSMRELLTEQFEMEAEYVEKVVTTCFRNGKPVDDIDVCRVVDGDEVALAAAMPGIAGICMRRNSPVGVYRRDITDMSVADEPPCDGTVTLRLFNAIAVSRGPELLARGVFVKGEALAGMLDESDPPWTETIGRALIEGRDVEPDSLADAVRNARTVYLFLEEEGG